MPNPGPGEDLLEPTLKPESVPDARLYSPTVLMLLAFFVGPVAVVAVGALDARRLGRLRSEWPLLAAALVAVMAAMVVLERALGGDRTEMRLYVRALGLVTAGGVYWLHRRAYRGIRLAGLGFVRFDLPLLLAVVLSLLLTVATLMVVHQ
jgi:hypothetical protein